MNHLSDEQIQEYLDKRESEGRPEIDTHLHTCPVCIQTLQQYQEIYQQLRRDPIPDLSKDFSGQVLKKIKAENRQETNLWENIIFMVLLVIGAAGISYLFNPLPLINSMFKPLYDMFINIRGQLPFQFTGIWLMVSAGVVILLFYEYLNIKILKPKS